MRVRFALDLQNGAFAGVACVLGLLLGYLLGWLAARGGGARSGDAADRPARRIAVARRTSWNATAGEKGVMEPSDQEILAMQSISDVLDWVGLEDSAVTDPPTARRLTRTSFLEALGTPTLGRQIVAVPIAVYSAATTAWRVH